MTTIINKSVTPASLIITRDEIISKIKENWGLITANNISNNPNKGVSVTAIYKEITENEAKLVRIKVALQAINMGLTSLKELPENNVYASIFTLSQLKERKVKLNILKASVKSGENVIFTPAYCTRQIEAIELEITNIESELKEYNDNIKFEMVA